MKTSILKFNILLLFFLIFSCNDFVEVDFPTNQLPSLYVFENETTANGAILNLYSELRDNSIYNGKLSSSSILFGLYADELDYYGNPTSGLNDIYLHHIDANNAEVKTVWTNSYKLIYMANASIQGLENSHFSSKNTLMAEVLFFRAFMYFSLHTIYNEIPYIKSTDYLVNSKCYKNSQSEIYANLIEDLENALVLLQDANINTNTRINKFTIYALLAKIHLYNKEWSKAINYSDLIIHSNRFQLVNDINTEFLKNSTSTIFQLKTAKEGSPTNEAPIFTITGQNPTNIALTKNFLNSFESGDLRKIYWVKSSSNGNWFFSSKYKQINTLATSSEYSIVFRLPEIILIRAEAYVNTNKKNEAISDINSIRNKAGLNGISNTNENLFEAILNERQHELFCEHGNRWFDLKRFGLLSQTLLPLKPSFQDFHQYFPIPESELILNQNLLPQNQGY
ncbi:RagB/SusD family nutrient uptake outer membrane protein [Empedobacter tilapiae]|uniref:RagB/SusD family nutrient uptake outer membrane protein n=1 Tax=Empedobacter tilapiae TaxID=2491114 RepID=UPI0028D49935|nr:RagB/SusD family nutrient uptake outer membrane protein [Empedobacter tilapiae]